MATKCFRPFVPILVLFILISSAPSSYAQTVIPRTGWTVRFVDSQELVVENGAATNSFDGDANTYWHTQYFNITPNPPPPHEIQINLSAAYNVSGFRYLPLQDGQNGWIGQYEFYVSLDGVNWGSPVASGTLATNPLEKEVSFSPKSGQYVRLRALSEVNGNPWTTMAELNVLQSVSSSPTITSIVPNSGPTAGGQTGVVITGTNLSGATSVTFGGTAATITNNTATTITVTTPAHAAGAVNVVATVSAGSVTSTGGYTYVTGPTITSIVPNSGPTAGGQTGVVITGTNLSGATSVTFGGTAATITNNTATTITVTTPAHAAGAVNVVATVSAGSVTSTGGYTYVTGPTITSIVPNSGPTAGGQTGVVITGTNLSGAASVTFGGTAATITNNTATTITVTTPAHAAGAVNVVATVSAGSVTSTGGYTYVTGPTITSIVPNSGPTAGGQTGVVITGTNLSGAASVTFGGTAATITNNTATTITVTTPAHAAGAVNVVATVSAGSVTSTGGYTYVTGPTITSIVPNSGPTAGGQTGVVITGTNLSGATSVTFGGTAATITGNTATTITVTTPAHAAGAVNVVTTVSAGTATSTGGYTYVSGPTITSIAPNSGPTAGGQTGVVITGTNLSGATSVTFGGTAATITGNTATTITVTTPAHAAGAVNVVANVSAGSVTSTGGYTYVTGPTITSVVPNSGPTAGGQTGVVITGTNLSGATSVTFGGTAATITNNTATTITVTTPAHAAGAVNVVATVAAGSATSTGGYTYLASPTITNIVPNSGPTAGGQTGVVITGTNLSGATSVTFGGTAATITNNTATTITVTTPAHAAGAVNVVATVSAGSVTSTGGYTYVTGPTITSIVPNSGPTAGGQTGVVITGTNLSGATSVTFGGTAATITGNTATTITVTTPAHAAGAVNVVTTVSAGTATSTGGYTYVSGPTITSIAPNSGPTAGGQTGVVITGTNLSGATSVTFGGTAATITGNTATTITVTTPAHAAGAVNVVANVSAGSVTSTGGYTYVTGPTITSVVPNSGPTAGGQTGVVITGTNLSGATSVTFGGTAATITNNTATTITVTTPAHAAGAVNVVATVAAGSATSTGGYTYLASPTITNIVPNSGPTAGGQTGVVITGTNLSGATSVTFGGTAATITNNTATTITVTTPAHAAGAVNVVATVSAGSVTSTGGYTYVTGPTITSIVPNSGPTAGGQTGVVITGTNLSGATSVTFGGTAATITGNTATTITVTTPAHAAGAVNVVATVSAGSVTSTGGYTYVSGPTITSIVPNSGPVGTSVTITGSNFGATQGTSTVRFNGTTATSITSWSATSIVALVPTGATTGAVVVTVAGVASNGVTFTVATNSTVIPRTAWTLHFVDSQELAAENGAATNSFDGDSNTYWHTQYGGATPPPPHEIQINLGNVYNVSGFRYLPIQVGTTNGRIRQYEFYVGSDGSSWGSPVATGTFANTVAEKQVSFAAKTGRYVRLRALTEVNGNPWTTMAELNVLQSGTGANQAPNGVINSPAADATIVAGSAINFTGTGTDPNTNTPLSYRWSFGAGSGIADAMVEDPGLVQFNSPGTFVVSFTVTDSLGLSDATPATRTITVQSGSSGTVIPRTNWTLHFVDSQEVVGENGAAMNSFDGNANTYWHTQYFNINPDPPPPHDIQINLGSEYNIGGFRYLPVQDGQNGWIAQYEFYVSLDGVNWGSPVASGTLAKNPLEKEVSFIPRPGQYVRLRALSEVNGNPWTSMAELNVLQAACITPSVNLNQPQSYYLQTSTNLHVVANACLSGGQGVRLMIDGGTAGGGAQFDDYSAPYEINFSGLSQSEHIVDAFVIDSVGTPVSGIATHDQAIQVGIGDYYVAMGDSITQGAGDTLHSDDSSQDGRDIGSGGYPPILNDLLTAALGRSHNIANEGVSGAKSTAGISLVSTLLQMHPNAQRFLIMYGMNDASGITPVPSGLGLQPGNPGYPGSFKHNMQQIINAINNAGKVAILAKVPVAVPLTGQRNQMIEQYNLVIDELVANPANNIPVPPPDFHTYFETNHPTEYFDDIHPNGIGYQSMGDLWIQVLVP